MDGAVFRKYKFHLEIKHFKIPECHKRKLENQYLLNQGLLHHDFPVKYLIRYKSNELRCNRFKSWYSRKFAETFSSIPGVITPPTILKQHGIQKKHSLIKFTVVDTHDYVSPISRDIIDTAEEVASTKKTFYFY